MSHYQHLTINDREMILEGLAQSKTIREIARKLKRAPSTISREIKRHQCKNIGRYSPDKAQNDYKFSKSNCGRKAKLIEDPSLFQRIKHLFLDCQWSPEEISQRLLLETGVTIISFITIYRGIYAGLFDKPGLSQGNRGAIRKLRHRGKPRHNKDYVEKRGKIPITNTIHERPEAANKRTEFGHWEADTVAGKTRQSCLVTFVDRKSRFLIASKATKKSSEPVTTELMAMFEKIGKSKLKTITPDRDKEFSKHVQLTSLLGIPFYFPDPHAPWQRGSNENTNGLLREYSPKGQSLDNKTNDEIQEIVNKLNFRPKKCLDWRTPYEVYFGKVLHLI